MVLMSPKSSIFGGAGPSSWGMVLLQHPRVSRVGGAFVSVRAVRVRIRSQIHGLHVCDAPPVPVGHFDDDESAEYYKTT